MSKHVSERLKALADMVTPGLSVVDVGCDHAFLPIRLCAEGKIPRAVASDIRPGPLAAAAENIRAAGLSDVIETRLSDGLRSILPGEVDAAVIAGMGGLLIRRILRESRETVSSMKELILAPQNNVFCVRVECEQAGFVIAEERLIREEEKYYPLIRLVPGGPAEPYTRADLLFGPLLLHHRDPVLHVYLQKQKKIQSGILRGLRAEKGKNALKRRSEIEEELAIIEEALQIFREVRK